MLWLYIKILFLIDFYFLSNSFIYMKILHYIFLFNLICFTNASAYIDPGSTSLIFQSILAAIAGGFAWIVIYYKKLKYYLKLFIDKISNKKKV